MPTLTLSTGPTVRYADSGGDGPVILLSHGFLLDGSMFDAQLPALTPAWRVITWDERGHGATTYDGEPFSYWDSARDALALLDALGVPQAVLGGMSQGGFLSLRAALLAPERVRALVLIDTQAGAEDPELLPVYEALHAQWLLDGPTPELAGSTLSIVLSPDPALLAPWVAKAVVTPREQLTAPFGCLVSREDLTPRLAEITVPALVLHGSEDLAIPVARGEALAAGLPGAGELVVIPGGAHASNVSHPDLVNDAVLGFLATL